MDCLINGIVDFIRVRQLNIAAGNALSLLALRVFMGGGVTWYQLAAVLTLVYLVYQYKDVLFKMREEPMWEDSSRRSRSRLSRSRSRSRSRSKARGYPLRDPNSRRGRRPTRRCPHCSQCNIDTDI